MSFKKIADTSFNVIMDLHMFSLGTLVPEGPWCVFLAKRHQVYWGLTHIVVFCWHSDLISHTKTHTTHSGASRLTHTHIKMYLHHLLCAHSSYLLYYTKWIIHWYQKFTFHNVFSFQNLFTCKSHVSID